MARGSSCSNRRRALKDHAHKKQVRRQQNHLQCIKGPRELRRIVLGSRHLLGNTAKKKR